MSFSLGTVIAGGLGALGSIGSGYISKGAVKEANKGNMRLAEYQYSKDLEQWNRANAYNSPSAQMQRLHDAGLNPNLIYGSGGATSLAAPSPKYDAPKLMAYQGGLNLDSAAAQFGNQLMNLAQLRKIEADTNLTKSKTRLTDFDADLTELRKIQQAYVNSKTKDEADLFRDMYESKIRNMQASTSNINSMINYRELYQMPNTAASTDMIENHSELYRQQSISAIAERSLISYRAALMISQVAKNEAQANQLNAWVESFLPSLIRLNNANADYREIESVAYDNARQFGINPNNNSEVGTILNFIVGATKDIYNHFHKDK